MKKRKFSPAQLAAQKRFAALAKAGKLRRKNGKKKNTTIIKAKKISHLDVSKVHNGMASAKKRPIAKKRNAEHRDAQHPIHVRDYWQGRRGYKSQWQRAHEAGQRQLFGVKNPGFAEKFHDAVWMWATHKTENGYAWKVYSVQYQKPSVTVAEGIKPTRAQAAAAAKKSAMVYRRWAKAQKAKNPRRGTRKLAGVAKRAHKLYQKDFMPKTAKALHLAEKRRLLKDLHGKKRNSSSHAYRGYLIKHNAIHDIWFISSGGVHVGSANSLAAAKKTIDELTGKQNPRRGMRSQIVVKKQYLAKQGHLKDSPARIQASRQLDINELRRTRAALAMKTAESEHGRDSKQYKKAHLAWQRLNTVIDKLVNKIVHNPGRRRTVKAKRNGANTSLARRRREEFVGRPSTQTKTLYAPNGSGASGTLSQLGKLHKLHIKGGKTYNFKGVPTLAQHPKTDQLFVLGKNYTVNAPKKNPGDRMVDLGEVKTIEYEAVKTHLGDSKPVRYYHHFGEEGGERPHALVNEEGLIIFSGGDYYIRPEGIRD